MRIGDLVQIATGESRIVWSINNESISIISFCAEDILTVQENELILITSATGSDSDPPELYYRGGDIVYFKCSTGIMVGLVRSYKDRVYNLEYEVYRNGSLDILIEQDNVLGMACPLVQTLFRRRWNTAIFRQVKMHHKKACKSRRNAKALFEQAEELRREAEALLDKVHDEKEEAEHCDDTANRLMSRLI